jgi:hypothetical protein
VRAGNFPQLRRAMHLSTMLWGGRFNPIIPVDDAEHAKQLSELFHVDALYAVEPDPVVDAFVAANSHVAYPRFIGPFLLKGSDTTSRHPRTTLLDVGFVIDAHAREKEKDSASLAAGLGAFPVWADDDPLSDVLLASFGVYPDDEWGRPLNDSFTAAHGKTRRLLDRGEPLPTSMLRQWNPLALTRHGLWPSRGGLTADGIFVGSAGSFDDLVDFWNLCAVDHALIFFDPAQTPRLLELVQTYIGLVEEGVAKLADDDWRKYLNVWGRDRAGLPEQLTTTIKVLRHGIDSVIWNGLNEKPPRMATEHTGTVASVATGQPRPSMTFQVDLPEMFRPLEADRQFVVMTVRPHHTGLEREGYTFAAPNVPEMNEYYGREMLFEPDYARVEPDGLGIITRLDRSYFNVYALPITELFQRLFQTFGLKARPSRAGTIARRLVHQMGGLQSCRVFKIAGVRRLIETFAAHRAFTHTQALQQIGPGFKAYRKLYIEQRTTPGLEPNDAFLYLVAKDVLRAGLEFRCPTCELDFWVLLDDAATMMDCEYCGARFNATTQLRDKDGWKYRRSGLFGREDHQEGAVPVTLALQRLDTSVSNLLQPTLYTTGLDIESGAVRVPPCEVDFAFLAHHPNGRVQLVIGEAKSGQEIAAADVANIKVVAAAFPRSRMDVFPTFAKVSDFTRQELERCLEPAKTYPKRHILLSRPELEPYDLHERFSELRPGLRYSSDVEDLAEATHELYRAILDSPPGVAPAAEP